MTGYKRTWTNSDGQQFWTDGTFSCDDCGNRYPWYSRRKRCQCGCTLFKTVWYPTSIQSPKGQQTSPESAQGGTK